MPVTVDQSKHRMRIECDGKKTPMHCDVAMEVTEDSRAECNMRFYKAGWRLDDKRTLCASCLKRERPDGL